MKTLMMSIVIVILTTSSGFSAPPPDPWPDDFTLTIAHTAGIDDVAGVFDGLYPFTWDGERYSGAGASPGPGWSGQISIGDGGPIYSNAPSGDELDIALALNGSHVVPTVTGAYGGFVGATVHAPEPCAALMLWGPVAIFATRRRRRSCATSSK